jgi:flagellar biosynthesis protein FlhF
MPTETLPTAPGTCFRFTVASAEQAAAVIREKLGEHARVLSVRTVAPGGITGLFSSPKLEVIAQVVAPDADPAPAELPPAAASADERVTLRNARARFRAPRQSLAALLRRSGFSETLLQRLEASPAWVTLEGLPLHRALVETGRHLRDLGAAQHDRAPLTRAAFLGTPGVGRTTALCKWLAAEVFRRARLGHVVMAEFDRPNLAGPLPVFCEAMGVPLAHFPASTQPATPGGFVYFDLPGLSVRHPGDNAAIAEFLEREQIDQRVLVLNAAYAPDALRAAYAAGRDLGATHVVFTHLDEVTQWGRLWDYLLDGGLEPLFLATGPSLTGDCEEDAFDAVARRTLPNPEPVAEPVVDDAEASTLNTAA